MHLVTSLAEEAYERELFKLQGRSISEVEYVELEGRGDALRACDSDDFESLDYGFEWRLDTGVRCSFIWAWEFMKQKVSFSHESLTLFGRHWDATERWRRRGMIETRIVRVEVDWLTALDPAMHRYPQCVYVHFESGASIHVAARDGVNEPAESHLLTTFFVAAHR